MPHNALVTGASSGIGRACALELARRGFGVALNDLPGGDALDAAVREASALGAGAVAAPADLAAIDGHEAMLELVESALGPLTTLVCNAGVPALARVDMLETTPESYDRCLAVNARATFFLCQVFARRLLARERAVDAHHAIVVVSSVNAVAASTQRAEYCVSKAGASMVAKLFALRLAGEGIQVFDVQPGVIETRMTAPVMDEYRRRIAEEGLSLVPRAGRPEEVAATIATAVTGGLPYAAGQVLRPDGGLALERL